MLNRAFTSSSIGAIAAAGLFCVVEPTQATVITRNGSTVVSDTYEGDTVGSGVVGDSGAWDPSNGNYLWSPSTIAAVTNSGSPGAYSGSQYAIIANGSGNNHLTASMTLAVGNALKFDSMVYIPSTTAALDYPFQFMVIGDNAIDGSTLGLPNRLLDFYRYANGNWETSGVAGTYSGPSSFAANTWQRWTLDYTVGAASATLTIDGVSASILAANTVLQGSNGILTIIAGGGQPIYFDNVPEPTSVAAVAIGALALMRRRHH